MTAAQFNEQARSLIIQNPKLRADYFRNPRKVLAWAEPRQGILGRLSPASLKTRDSRAALGDAIEKSIEQDPRLVSAREAIFEQNAFLHEALRNPQRTFTAIVTLSYVAFFIGIGLIVGAFLAAFLGDGTPEKALLGGLSGLGGAITTLGTIFRLSTGSIRRANGDNAQLHLILTDFATEIANYRALPVNTLADATQTNEAISRLTEHAVQEIQTFAEPPEETAKPGVG
jgi:hypothetical protein